MKDALDPRFYYEPILSGHPRNDIDLSVNILDSILKIPIWVSSMTGGTEMAKTINTNLAKACEEFGMGMGLGSCRSLLDSNERLSDFAMRQYMPNQPLYANLGVAQVEELIQSNRVSLISDLVDKLEADGLIFHVNPMQEWLQPEGDIYYMSPLEMVKRLLDALPDLKIIVKEVGQGMGPKSMEALYRLPIQAVDFAAGGGTNFAKLELFRAEDSKVAHFEGLAKVGHSAYEMVDLANEIVVSLGDKCLCKETIISGGVSDYLDGYYLLKKFNGTAIYGQASSFLKNAMGDYESLRVH
ncbi:MAG: isopentenyl-diphosphate delta-isomerase, partial [Saprospiraceae bacterium]|nr:isopentenyl-diphosphate delta-isomerase [Saprospiraceae bacterium]